MAIQREMLRAQKEANSIEKEANSIELLKLGLAHNESANKKSGAPDLTPLTRRHLKREIT